MARQQPLDGRSSAHGEDWWDRAACLHADPELFYPEKGESNADAKSICATCPVRIDCLEHALKHSERYGVWGGLSAQERRVVARHVARRGISVRDLKLRIDPDRKPTRPPVSQAKITRGQAEEIRARYAAGGVTQTALADEYGIAQNTVSRIIAGRTWRDTTQQPQPQPQPQPRHRQARRTSHRGPTGKHHRRAVHGLDMAASQ